MLFLIKKIYFLNILIRFLYYYLIKELKYF